MEIDNELIHEVLDSIVVGRLRDVIKTMDDSTLYKSAHPEDIVAMEKVREAANVLIDYYT
jgi:hypothetical protein